MLRKYHTENLKEVGIDEAGRGCLFGPVCIASVSLTNLTDPLVDEIKDSKKLSQKKREKLFTFIKENSIYSVKLIDHDTIDKENILQATLNGMHLSLDEIDNKINIDLILVDGNHFPNYFSIKQDKYINHECVINGDNIFVNIAAASILAKVTRDNYIIELCEKNEELKRYDLHKNKGYGTKKHMEALKEYGTVEGHRKSFKPCKK